MRRDRVEDPRRQIANPFGEFAGTWREKYPAMAVMWERSWPELVPFRDFPIEIRKLIYTTNGIESLNARFRHAVRRRGHFPTEQAGRIQPVNATR
jgi:putative transposase